jgi:ribosomal-protein-alanine N-acetyltransferase
VDAVLAFELANRAYFARFITDRGDDFYERYAERHRDLLIEQDSGACIFHVLIDRDGAVSGRFNLYEIVDGSAVVGYRVAQRVAGRGVATSAVRELCRLAQADYGLRMLTAATNSRHRASQRVLEKAGFSATEACVLAGQPGIRYTLRLSRRPAAIPRPGARPGSSP